MYRIYVRTKGNTMICSASILHENYFTTLVKLILPVLLKKLSAPIPSIKHLNFNPSPLIHGMGNNTDAHSPHQLCNNHENKNPSPRTRTALHPQQLSCRKFCYSNQTTGNARKLRFTAAT